MLKRGPTVNQTCIHYACYFSGLSLISGMRKKLKLLFRGGKFMGLVIFYYDYNRYICIFFFNRAIKYLAVEFTGLKVGLVSGLCESHQL